MHSHHRNSNKEVLESKHKNKAKVYHFGGQLKQPKENEDCGVKVPT